MADNFAQLRYQREQFLKAVYELGRGGQIGEAYMPDIAPRVGLQDTDGNIDERQYERLAQDLIDDGDVTSMSDGHTIVCITSQGRHKVENS
jgi:hypothetical protein